MISLNINNLQHEVDLPEDTPLLWTLRDEIGLTGTKFGCGMALCGACTVHLDGQPIRSCVTPISAVVGKKITTIEAMAEDSVGHAVQQAWMALGVPQCGYCQAGQIMSATALLKATPKPSDEQIDAAMSGNICRCGTYTRIRAAIKQVAAVQGVARGVVKPETAAQGVTQGVVKQGATAQVATPGAVKQGATAQGVAQGVVKQGAVK